MSSTDSEGATQVLALTLYTDACTSRRDAYFAGALTASPHPPVDEQIQEDHDEHAEDLQRNRLGGRDK
jgi:hypothetical protein